MTFLTSNAMLIPYLCRHLLLCSRQGQTLARILWEAVQTRSMSPCTSHHPVWDGIFLKHALFEKLLITKTVYFWNLLIFANCLLNIKWTRSKGSFWRSFIQYFNWESMHISARGSHEFRKGTDGSFFRRIRIFRI